MPVREIPKNYSNLTGKVFTLNTSNLTGFESSLEKDFLLLYDFDLDTETIEEQPVSIPYTQSNGLRSTYTPDFLVEYRSDDGADLKKVPELCEVKYRKDLFNNWVKLKPKFKAARAYAKARGWIFKIITEKEIQSPFLDNARFLKAYINRKTPSDYTRKLLAVIQNLKITTPQVLLELTYPDKWERAYVLPELWKLIGTRNIGFDFSKPLTMKSQIWPETVWFDNE